MPPSGSTNRFLAAFSGAFLPVAVLASATRYRFGDSPKTPPGNLTLYVTKCGEFGAEPWEKGQNRAGDSHGSVNLHLCRIQVVWDDPEAFDGASGPPDAPFLPAYTLDTGIRLNSNTCPGGPGEVPYGEVNAYPGNTRFVSGNGWNSVG